MNRAEELYREEVQAYTAFHVFLRAGLTMGQAQRLAIRKADYAPTFHKLADAIAWMERSLAHQPFATAPSWVQRRVARNIGVLRALGQTEDQI